MQIFLPYPDVGTSLRILDKLRLGKQRVEAKQIIDSIQNGGGWKHHPCIKMYRNYLEWLIRYYNFSLNEYKYRGGNNIKLTPLASVGAYVQPTWLGENKFHLSHRSNLLRKAIDDRNGIASDGKNKKASVELYNNLKRFNITEDNTPVNLPYLWPV